jgi:DNA-binding transcriptional MerR regulator
MPGKSGKSGQAKKSSRTSRAKAGSKSSAASSGGAMDGTPDPQSDEAARLALHESDKLYYRIGEVSRITSVKAHVLRYWETEFRWMAPPKSRSKQRLYRKRDIEFVWLLKRLLWDERYTIAGARQRIQELGVDEALALLDRPNGAAAIDAASTNVAGAGAGAAAPKTGADGDSAGAPSNAAWVSFRSALDEMQTDLVALRGVLQDGA